MSKEELPSPLVATEVDLRGLDYMPLFGNHLFGSEFNASANDSEWRAAITLWWAAWNQVPAGSLPDDDAALCRLADLGRDVKGWKKLRARALHGFVKCSDGRLYHEFICGQALVAWDKRVKERERKAKWRADKDAKNAGQTKGHDADVPRDMTRTELGHDADVPADGTGRDGTGRLKEESARNASSAERAPDDGPPEAQGHTPTPAGAVCQAMRRAGLQATNPGDPRLLALIEQGATLPEFEGIAAEAVSKGKGWAWVLAVLPARRTEAAAITLPPAQQAAHAAPAKAVADTQQYLANLAEETRRAREAYAAKKTQGAAT